MANTITKLEPSVFLSYVILSCILITNNCILHQRYQNIKY